MAQDNAALLALLASNPVPQGLIHAYGIISQLLVLFIDFRFVHPSAHLDIISTLR
jgi:hypothetical protein